MDRTIRGLVLVLGLMLLVLAGLAIEYKRQMSGGRKSVTAASEVPGYGLEVSDVRAVESWLNSRPYTYARHKGKWAGGEISGVEVVLSDRVEQSHKVGDGAGGVLQTGGFGYKRLANRLEVRIQMEPGYLDKMVAGDQRLFSRWVLAYLCMGADSYRGDFDGCWQEADRVLPEDRGWFRLSKKTGWSFSLVKEVYAACGTSDCCTSGTEYRCGCDPLGEFCDIDDLNACGGDGCDACTVPVVMESNTCSLNSGVCVAPSCSTGAFFPCSECSGSPPATPTTVDCSAVCTTWSLGNCGANPCEDDEKKYTRDCGNYSSVCEETECRYRAVCDCTPTDPDAAGLLLPTDGHVETGDFSVDLSWSAPAFSIDLEGVVDEQPGKAPIKIPFTLGLMPDIMEREELAIVSIYQNPERPDGPDKLVRYFLRMCWYNYNREHENGQVSWGKYLDLVRAGEGKYKVVVADPESGTWNGTIPSNLTVIEKSPLDGFALYDVDKFYGLSRSVGEVVIDGLGKLVIISSYWKPEHFYKQAEKNGDVILGYGYNYSAKAVVLMDVFVTKELDEIFRTGGYVNTPRTGSRPPGESLIYANDMKDPVTGLCTRPYFLVGTK